MGCFWIFLTTELRSLTFCRPGVCKLGAPCGKRSTWRSRVGLIIFTITELLLRGVFCIFFATFCVCKSHGKNLLFICLKIATDCNIIAILFMCDLVMKRCLETMSINITVNMISQTACPDRHDVMCCLPPSYLGSAYVSGVWTVTK